MADNYLEKKYEALQERKAREQRAKQIAWKKRMDAYRKRLALEKEAAPQTERQPADGGEKHP
ncbi:MAG: hypothetical protein E7112_09430 [Bacteroidales bacterium]|nr:hypothetical protein [Bacteroidales bacterium]